MLHLTLAPEAAEPISDVFELRREHLFGWREDVAARARAFGEEVAERGLSSPLMLGAIGGTAHMLAAHWESECGRPPAEANGRADRFARLAHAAAFAALGRSG